MNHETGDRTIECDFPSWWCGQRALCVALTVAHGGFGELAPN